MTPTPIAAVLDDLQRQRLLQLAHPLHAATRDAAAGRCLALSLEVALQANCHLHLDLQLVRWRVQDEVDYAEHWAVMLAPREVLDPTHAQVDGNAALLHALDSYPAHFKDRREYPASLFMPAYKAFVPAAPTERLPARCMTACALEVFKYDLQLAWQRRSPSFAARTLVQGWRRAGGLPASSP